MIADITEDVETEFGTYHPQIVEVTPVAHHYVIEPGFANVVNFADFSFSAVEESLLLKNAFVAKPSSYMEVYDIYNECTEMGTPIFVTTDALLHIYHRFYDRLLRTAEERQFYGDLTELTEALYENSDSLYQAAGDSVVRDALRLNVAYLGVARALIDSQYQPPAYIQDLVSAESDLIETHEGFSYSPIFCYSEDYSQYLPRGHYTRSDSLRSYFQAMMWLGRMTFIIESPPFPIPCDVDSLIHESTRKAILLVYSLQNTTVGGEPALDVWERIYLPTVFFVGRTDDLNIYQYLPIMKQIYGEGFASLPVDTFADDSLVNQFLDSARELPDPRIPTRAAKGFRLMGQRFIPDSYILSQLTTKVDRPMPKGLDVMSVLGSERAYGIMDSIYHEPDCYPLYAPVMDSLKAEFAALPDATWAQDLYYNWLYSLMPLLFAKGGGYPTFMRNQAWTDRELYAALGSWTELRHDTILYGKQSLYEGAYRRYEFNCYVEPNPYLFARLASLVNLMGQGLDELGLLFDDFGERLSDLELLLLCLKAMAEKELVNQTLTTEEYELLANIGVILESLVDFGQPYPMRITAGPHYSDDDQMPLVADVHTYGEGEQCLEEGIGYPFNLFVIVEINGELKVTRGAGFSYFEFIQPISERLTDEAWREILQTDSPDPLVWSASFVDLDQGFTVPSPIHYPLSDNHLIPDIDTTGIVEDNGQGSTLPLSFEIYQNYPNPFNANTVIRYSIPDRDREMSLHHTTLKIYNITGQEVRTLVAGNQLPGLHTVIWDGKGAHGQDVGNGVYFCRLEVIGDGLKVERTRKMVLLR